VIVALSPLIKAMEDPEPTVRYAAAIALGPLGYSDPNTDGTPKQIRENRRIVPKSMDKCSVDMELTEGNRFNLLQQMDRSLHLRILFQSVAL